MDGSPPNENGGATHVERSANLDAVTSKSPATALRGNIRQLRHLSAGTDVASTRLVSTHNGVGYGYIETADGDVFFDASAVTNLAFDQLKRDMAVDFVLDQAPYLRASRVTLVVGEPGIQPG